MEKELSKESLKKVNPIKIIGGDILVVDDTPASLELLLNMLNEQNYRVRVTTRGSLVATAIKLSAPDLILLDINMPDMNGYQVCEQLKADPETFHIPVIFLSASDEVFDKVKAFRVGGVDYITKPFQFEEVLVRIESQLKIAYLQKELEKKASQLEKKTALLEKANEDLIERSNELARLYKRANLLFSAFSETLEGQNLAGKYHLIEQIGKGGNGIVYKALEIELNRLVAVKIFRPTSTTITPELIKRLKLEGLSAIRLNHPNVTSVIDFGIAEDSLPYIVMELLQGHTLQEEIKKNSPLSLSRCSEIILPLCDVLDKMHSTNTIHRDIKPENIFLHQSLEGEVVKVLDFGIVKILSTDSLLDLQKITMTGNLLGTPAYIAPERLQNLPYDSKADIYSLAIVIYTMLTGQLPFQHQGDLLPFELNEKDLWILINLHLQAIPQPLTNFNKNIAKPIENIVLRALSKRPEFRPTALEIAAEFAKFSEKKAL